MGFPHILVKRAVCQKLFLGSLSKYFAVFQHNNIVGRFNGRKSVGNYQQSFALGESCYGLLYLMLVSGSVNAVASSRTTMGAF